eukprot:TRINITY_DN17881_c0_g1_i1.p1 TRINITY_DN17881_c0_g1~~TRINITY_DN17881_c0_g1_i1.p1  ORF type:complete len:612 (-),score=116.74 TRINITY_DN17881_c0_g1_i1:65-1711(-)
MDNVENRLEKLRDAYSRGKLTREELIGTIEDLHAKLLSLFKLKLDSETSKDKMSESFKKISFRREEFEKENCADVTDEEYFRPCVSLNPYSDDISSVKQVQEYDYDDPYLHEPNPVALRESIVASRKKQLDEVEIKLRNIGDSQFCSYVSEYVHKILEKEEKDLKMELERDFDESQLLLRQLQTRAREDVLRSCFAAAKLSVQSSQQPIKAKELETELKKCEERANELKKEARSTPLIFAPVIEKKENGIALQVTISGNLADFQEISFKQEFCKRANIPVNSLEVDIVRSGSPVIIECRILREPDLDDVIKAVNRGDLNSLKLKSILIGNYGVDIGQAVMDPKWNKEYRKGPGGTYWESDLIDKTNRGGIPYFCPLGWKRYAIQVPDFDKKYEGFAIVYHGSTGKNAASILNTGLKVDARCHSNYIPVASFTPSIVYAAHPLFSRPWRRDGKYVQMIFQCRVRPEQVIKKESETLLNQDAKSKKKIDPNFKTNRELQWLVKPRGGNQGLVQWGADVVCYGIMIRVCDRDPKLLPESDWWAFCDRFVDY